MVGLAVANGAFREGWLVPRLGEHQGRQAATVLLILLLAVYIGAVMKLWPARSSRHAIAIGALWYDLASGRLWALVPLTVAVAPLVFYRYYRLR